MEGGIENGNREPLCVLSTGIHQLGFGYSINRLFRLFGGLFFSDRFFSLLLSNAAPEWQPRSMWWRCRELVVACPLEGLVRLDQ